MTCSKGLNFLRAYIDNLMVFTEGDLIDYVQKLELNLIQSKESGV